jgi:hypothetical protein
MDQGRWFIAWQSSEEHDVDVKRRVLLLTVAAVSGVVCLAAGLSYLTVSPTELSTPALVVAGALGCSAIVAAGLWQLRATGETRRARLIALGALGVTFSLASSIGIMGARVARSARLEPTGLPIALHAIGLALGIILSTAVAVELAGNSFKGSPRARPFSRHSPDPR